MLAMRALLLFSVMSLALLFPRKGNLNGNRNGTYLLIETHEKHQSKTARGSTPSPHVRRPRVSNKAFGVGLIENEQGQITKRCFRDNIAMFRRMSGFSESSER